jgi:hypothetical protein
MTDAAAAAAASPAGGAPDPAAAAAAASPDPKPAAAPGGAAPAGQAPADPGASAVYRPEGLPDHLLGTTERETIDKLFKAVDGYRKGDAARGEKIGSVPDAPDKYAFQPAEAVAAYLPDVTNDPVFKSAQAAAHKHGLGDKQFAGFVNEFMAGLVQGQMLDDPFSADKERAIIAGDVQDPGERAKAADKVAKDTVAFLDAMVAQNKLPKETAEWAKGRTDRGHFLKLMQVMRSSAPSIELGGSAPSGITREDLRKRQADPRQQTDPTFAAETDRLYRELIGDGEGRA